MYGDQTLNEFTCRFWFRIFKSGNFNVNDAERPGQPKKFEDDELQALLDEDTAQTLKELAEASTISDRLHAMRKLQKEGLSINYLKVTL